MLRCAETALFQSFQGRFQGFFIDFMFSESSMQILCFLTRWWRLYVNRHIPLWWLTSQCVIHLCVCACRCTSCLKDEPRLQAIHLALWLFLFRAFSCASCVMILVDSNHSFVAVSISHYWALVPEGQVYKIRTSLHNKESKDIPLMWKKGCVVSLTIEGVDWVKAGKT